MKTYRQTFIFDPQIGYKFQPNLNVTIIGDEKDNMQDYKLIVDKFGYRNYLKELTSNDKYISIDNLFIGCSFTAGDGVENASRFTNLIGDSYNAGLPGTCTIQHFSIAEDCTRFLKPKNVIFSPYLGCLSRSYLSQRSTYFLSSRHNWYKPYFKNINGEITIKNSPVPYPKIDFENEFKNKKNVYPINKIFKKIIDKIPLKNKNDLNILLKPFNGEDQLLLCKKLYTDAKKLFPDSKFTLAPIPHYDFLRYSSQYERALIKNFFRNLTLEVNYNYIDLISSLLEENYENLYYLIDGHFNKKGHQYMAEIFKKFL